MRLKFTESFKEKLNDHIEFIAKDKPTAARKFKSLILNEIREIPHMPYKNRKSIFFDKIDIRDLVVKGYLVVYKINKSKNSIEVFGFTRYEENPFK
jgi:plasmid stabilization system protein ParE